MKLSIYQIDAFCDKVFGGNPAAVCPLQEWLPDALMQQIAFENNLPETVFYVPTPDGFHIRWFTPTIEVDLCGHATLATAHVMYKHLGYAGNEIHFNSRSGMLKVSREGEWLTLDFPEDVYSEVELTDELKAGFNHIPVKVFKGKTDYLFVFDTEEQIKTITPNLGKITQLPCRGVIVTAKGSDIDFVSRFFGPQTGIDEDPATGSAHTTLTPYWAGVFGKDELTARQLSSRGGLFKCKLNGDRVLISGQAVTYLVGEIEV